jgi:hypothetical protein
MEIKIKTPKGEGTIKETYISELGFLMLRVKMGDKFKTYNLGKVNKMLENKNIEIC